MNSEKIHDLTVGALGLAQRSPFLRRGLRFWMPPSLPSLTQTLWHLTFPHPVGLAAGWDKNAKAPYALANLGFGFLELGTVTLWPEKGHPKPRIFRSLKGQWIANRIGFANEGAVRIVERLKRFGGGNGFGIPVGVSLGKMLSSSDEDLPCQVVRCLELFYPYVDFFSVNVSSPNTPKGFALGEAQYLRWALALITKANQELAQKMGFARKPLFVKMAPQLKEDKIESMANVFEDLKIDGVIATNSAATPYGGISGLPLKAMAVKTVAHLYKRLKNKIPIIGVGGILTPQDAWERIAAGASLIQIFSGFVFHGPGLIKKILLHLDWELKNRGLGHIQQACGIKAR